MQTMVKVMPVGWPLRREGSPPPGSASADQSQRGRVQLDRAVTRLADAPADGLAMREILLLRLHALLARAHADDTAYRDYRDRYRAKAKFLDFEGHMEWAEAMP